ncbi:MAG: mandelate racemase/muconate lactonizing enzyme family protein [Pseudomonadota bacterium]
MKIKSLNIHVLLADDFDETLTSSAQDSLLVVLEDEDGFQGFGESDVNPWIGRACIDAPGTHTMGLGLRDMLFSEPVTDIRAFWERAYIGTAMNGRRGAVVHALGALEMALWDLKGKREGKPVWQLLGRDRRPDPVVPYASLQPNGLGFHDYRDALCAAAERAKGLGFCAMKAEVTMNGPYAHDGMKEPYERHTELIGEVRKTVGSDVTLMVDVQYMFPDAKTAAPVMKEWEEFELFFVETPVWCDDLHEYAKLAEAVDTPIAMGEWLATRHEFADLIARGGVSVAQPDVGRVGGVSEALLVADMAAEKGLTIVPHCWKTGVSTAATAHFAAVTPHCKFIEYLPQELCIETLRKELTTGGVIMKDGVITGIDDAPGYGINLNWDAVKAFAQE